MDTVKFLPINTVDDLESINIPDLTDEMRSIFVEHVDLIKVVTESNQLFDVFYFNLLNMRNSIVLSIGDTATKTIHYPNYDSEFIAINAFVINLISSAKTLTEFLGNSAKKWLSEDSSPKDKFNQYLSDIYDTQYIYRLLINLRNYAQHGNIPVSSHDGLYGFDFTQIINPSFFTIKGNHKKDLEHFIEVCEIPGENIPYLSLTLTLANFTVQVIDIYRKYLYYMRKTVSSSYKNIKKIISDDSTLVCHKHKLFKNHIFYDCDDRSLHCFDISVNPNATMNLYQKKVADIYNAENKQFEELNDLLKSTGKLMSFKI